jgi:AraC-like DNA-binding protein
MIQEQKTLMYKNQIVFERIRLSHFKRIPKLYQKNEACFMFINQGEFSARTPDEIISFNDKKGLIAKCFNYFFETSKEQQNSNEPIEVVGVLIHQSIVEELFQFDITESNHSVDYNIAQVHIDGLLNNFKESLNILLDNPELADETLIKTKLKEFILLVSKTQKAPSHLDFLSAMFKKKSSEFSKTITNNLYSNLSMDELAHLCSMSLSAFKRKFKEEFNNSPKKYITNKKLEKASKLLASKENRVSDVAYDCGFETISTFNRSFKSFYGKSPTEYRLDFFA